jgi:hypothetical protein
VAISTGDGQMGIIQQITDRGDAHIVQRLFRDLADSI